MLQCELWPKVYLFWWVFHGCLKKGVCCFCWFESSPYVRSHLLLVFSVLYLYWNSVRQIILCWKWGVEVPTLIVDLLIYPFNHVHICLKYFEVFCLDSCLFLVDWSFYYYTMFLFLTGNSIYFEFYYIWYSFILM